MMRYPVSASRVERSFPAWISRFAAYQLHTWDNSSVAHSDRRAPSRIGTYPPGRHCLSVRGIERRPELVCEWVEGLTEPEVRFASEWASLHRMERARESGELTPRVDTGRRRERIAAALARLGGEGAGGGGNLEHCAQAAVRAGFGWSRLLTPRMSDWPIARFVEITQAVDFAMAYGDNMFANLCGIAGDSGLPFRDLAHAAITAMQVGVPLEPLGDVELVQRFPRRENRFTPWRISIGIFLIAIVLFVLVVLILGALDTLPANFPF